MPSDPRPTRPCRTTSGAFHSSLSPDDNESSMRPRQSRIAPASRAIRKVGLNLAKAKLGRFAPSFGYRSCGRVEHGAILDGLLYHESDLRIAEHCMDTAGFTDHGRRRNGPLSA